MTGVRKIPRMERHPARKTIQRMREIPQLKPRVRSARFWGARVLIILATTSGTPRPNMSSWCVASLERSISTRLHIHLKVQAAQFFTQEDDGLARPWSGRIFCNPPYSKGLITPFVDKLLAEISIGNVQQAILLTHNHSDTRWFQEVLGKASRVCLTAGRLGFYGPNGEMAAPVQGQAFHYFGENVERFEAVFSAIGTVLEPKARTTPAVCETAE